MPRLTFLKHAFSIQLASDNLLSEPMTSVRVCVFLCMCVSNVTASPVETVALNGKKGSQSWEQTELSVTLSPSFLDWLWHWDKGHLHYTHIYIKLSMQWLLWYKCSYWFSNECCIEYSLYVHSGGLQAVLDTISPLERFIKLFCKWQDNLQTLEGNCFQFNTMFFAV